jgi:hypothetical protein
MSWRDLLHLCLVLVGVVLFLYGSNYYEALVGWAGVVLMVGGFAAEIALKVYEFARKRGGGSEAVKL